MTHHPRSDLPTAPPSELGSGSPVDTNPPNLALLIEGKGDLTGQVRKRMGTVNRQP